MQDFLIKQGASPVFYICSNSLDKSPKNNLENIFRDGMNAYLDWQRDRSTEAYLQAFLNIHVFPMMVFWKHGLADTDEKNYYMEREWRVHRKIDFSIDDIQRIILPKAYADPLRKFVPRYAGEIIFSPFVTY